MTLAAGDPAWRAGRFFVFLCVGLDRLIVCGAFLRGETVWKGRNLNNYHNY